MATVFREPLLGQSFARRIGKVDVIPNLLLTTLAVVAVPFGLDDWQGPTRARFVQSADIAPNMLVRGIPAGPVPFNQDDWPAPFESRVISNDVVPNIVARGIPAGPAPFNQTDWSAPFRKPSLSSDVFPNPVVRASVAIPFNQDDFPVPFRARFVPNDIPPNVALYNAPVFSPAWNDPGTQNYKRITLRVDVPPNLTLLQQPTLPPFGLDDWTPAPKYRSAQQAEVVPNILVRGILAAAAPFNQDDWPPPFRAKYCEPPNDWLNSPLTTLAPITGALTGVTGTGSVGSLIPVHTLTLSGVSGTGSVGTVIPFAGTLVQLMGVSAIGSVGSVSLIKLIIPNVKGSPLGTAGLLLNNASFQVGVLTYESSTTIALGSVIDQNPVGGTLAFEDTAVALLVSSGFPSPTNTPVGGIKLPNLPNKILPPTNALVDGRGVIATNWWRFLANVSNQAMGTNQTPPATVTVGASPYVFSTPAQGMLLVSGGPVTLIEYSKDGVTWYPTGVTQGQIQMVPNDQIRITYMNAPTVTFFPR